MRSASPEIESLKREQKNDAIAYKAAIERQDELRAERDQLSKELESHKGMLLAAACDIGAIGEALCADMNDDGSAIEVLAQEIRLDAERYRWLREAHHFDTPQHQLFCKAYGSALDEEIDVVLAREIGQ